MASTRQASRFRYFNQTWKKPGWHLFEELVNKAKIGAPKPKHTLNPESWTLLFCWQLACFDPHRPHPAILKKKPPSGLQRVFFYAPDCSRTWDLWQNLELGPVADHFKLDRIEKNSSHHSEIERHKPFGHASWTSFWIFDFTLLGIEMRCWRNSCWHLAGNFCQVICTWQSQLMANGAYDAEESMVLTNVQRLVSRIFGFRRFRSVVLPCLLPVEASYSQSTNVLMVRCNHETGKATV